MYENILEVLAKYENLFPEDVDLKKMKKYLENKENQGVSCIDRKNMNGHFTVSALVVRGGQDAITESEVLLLWHKTFNRLQQPGGHIDPSDKNVLDAIVREVKEETGIDARFDEEFAGGVFKDIPLSLDIHPIAANEKKQEGSHYHLDMFFLLRMKDEKQEIKNEDEGTDDARWVKMSDIDVTYNPVTYKAVQKYKLFSHKQVS